MDFTIRKINTKIFTGIPSYVEIEVNNFLNTLEQVNYVDMKVTSSDPETISVLVIYKVVKKLKA